jgi:cell division septal protein FtsQ
MAISKVKEEMAKSKPTRAEMLREKRGSRSRKTRPQKTRRSEQRSGGDFPPILVRGGMAAAVSHSQRRTKNNKRRFDIALNGQGAEMRLPSIPTFGVGWRLFSALLVGVLGFVLYYLWSAPFFSVDAIDVSGLVRLSDAEINAVADVVGKSIIFVDPVKIEQELGAAFPELEKISVETEVPNKVVINLVERQPVLAWEQDGQTYWIDEYGLAYQPQGDANPSIIVHGSDLMTSPETDSELVEDNSAQVQKIPLELVKSIQILSEKIPENSPITYDNQHGIGWFDSRGWQVYFGADGDMDLKWKVYWKTFKRLKKAGIQPALISVEHVHAPYYRLER